MNLFLRLIYLLHLLGKQMSIASFMLKCESLIIMGWSSRSLVGVRTHPKEHEQEKIYSLGKIQIAMAMQERIHKK